ncbi:hypothetical protein AGOR_G00095360 [Albula goreensis]|uniref:C-type lectin domain-containing protein n=1 Tax=Albula goreensis TaxID=1534307 RepID=A0A8T3DKX1_9TELE|nr:hypothetical protein AGOR_G00095360 [Albula goreensis]
MMADKVVYTEIKFKKPQGEQTETSVGIVHINDTEAQNQFNSKLIRVLGAAIFILLITIIGMTIKIIQLQGEPSRGGFRSQGERQGCDPWPNRPLNETPSTVTQHPLPKCPASWVAHKHLCYLLASSIQTRSSALSICSRMSSHLADTEDPDTLKVLRQHMGQLSYWIGLNRIGKENGSSWFWIDGRKLLKTPYFNNTQHSERYCAIVSNKFIYAEQCNSTRGYICEKKASSQA